MIDELSIGCERLVPGNEDGAVGIEGGIGAHAERVCLGERGKVGSVSEDISESRALEERDEPQGEAITIINEQEYGLAASIFSGNQKSVMRFIRRVRTGFVNVNAATGGSEAHMPFGGGGASGNGFRLGNAEEALRAFTEVKAVKWFPSET